MLAGRPVEVRVLSTAPVFRMAQPSLRAETWRLAVRGAVDGDFFGNSRGPGTKPAGDRCQLPRKDGGKAGGRRMPSAEYYRRQSEDLFALSLRLSSPDVAARFRKMADEYRTLAESLGPKDAATPAPEAPEPEDPTNWDNLEPG